MAERSSDRRVEQQRETHGRQRQRYQEIETRDTAKKGNQELFAEKIQKEMTGMKDEINRSSSKDFLKRRCVRNKCIINSKYQKDPLRHMSYRILLKEKTLRNG